MIDLFIQSLSKLPRQPEFILRSYAMTLKSIVHVLYLQALQKSRNEFGMTTLTICTI